MIFWIWARETIKNKNDVGHVSSLLSRVHEIFFRSRMKVSCLRLTKMSGVRHNSAFLLVGYPFLSSFIKLFARDVY